MSAQSRRERQVSRRAERKLAAERAARRKRQLSIVAIAIGIALVAAIVLIVVNRPGDRGIADIKAAPALAADLQPSGRTVGAANAPVKVIEYGDYQCPACENFYNTVETPLFDNYVKTGKITFEFMDFPFIGGTDSSTGMPLANSESTRAAEAAYCAMDQGKFWQFHNTLYQNQKQENSGGFTDARLTEMARQVGLNMTTFSKCFGSPGNSQHQKDVDNMYQQGLKAGVNATPSIFVDGTKVANNDYASVKAAIDAALAKK